MKRIMFYRKRSYTGGNGAGLFSRQNAGGFLIFTVFLCGTILGCAFFHADAFTHSLGMEYAGSFSSVSALWALANAGIRAVIIAVCFLFCSLSCFGAVPLCLIALCTGSRFGILASAFLESAGWKGFGIFVTLLLPGGVLLVLAELFMFSFGMLTAKQTAACTFGADGAQIRFKEYIRQTMAPAVFLIGYAATDCILRLLFAGLLFSG